MIESYLMFNSKTSGITGEDYVFGQKVVPTASIKVSLKPDTPFFALALRPTTLTVYPKTYGSWWDLFSGVHKGTDYIDALTVPVWIHDPQMSGSWELHTPFWVTVEKLNGTNTFSTQIYFDFVGGKYEVPVVNPKDSTEQIMISDLGKLTTGFNPPLYGNVVIFDENTAFTWDDYLLQDISYDQDLSLFPNPQWADAKVNDWSYSNYWFGGGNAYYTTWTNAIGTVYYTYSGRWEDDGSPSHEAWETITYPQQVWYSRDGHGAELVANSDYPGQWLKQTSSTSWEAHPIAGAVASDSQDPNLNPTPGLSLLHYLTATQVVTAGKTITKPSERVHHLTNLNTFGQGVSIDTTTNMLKVYLGYGSASSFYKLKISTELVDTIVYQEPQVELEITNSYWQQNNQKDITIANSATAVYDVKNLGTVEATAQVRLSTPSGTPIQYGPSSIQQKNIPVGEIVSFPFTITNVNSGTSTLTSRITAEAVSAGVTKDTDTTLTMALPPVSGVETALPVKVVDGKTQTPIPNIYVSLSTSTGPNIGPILSDANGLVSFHFGSSYSGPVTIRTANTTEYQSSKSDTTVAAGLNPTYVVSIYKWGEEDGEWTKYLPYVAAIVIVASITAGIYYYGKKHRFQKIRPKRRP